MLKRLAIILLSMIIGFSGVIVTMALLSLVFTLAAYTPGSWIAAIVFGPLICYFIGNALLKNMKKKE